MPSLFERLKVPVLTVLISLVLFFVTVKLFGPIPFAVNSVTTQKTDFFTVEGLGEATGIPDSAQFVVGVNKTATTVEEAQTQVNQAVTKITGALKDLGIAESDIKTTNYSVNPNIDYSLPRQTTAGYTVDATMTVTIKDANKANKALDTATANGANIISGVTFTINDEEKTKLEDQARTLAIKQAKEKAQKISNQAGIKLGRVINISVNGGTPGPVIYDKMALNAGGGTTPEAPTQLQPGENKVSITVTLFYETL